VAANDADRKRKERMRMIDRLRPPARLTPGTGPGGIPLANAASTPPTEGEEDLQEASLFGAEAAGEAPVDEAEETLGVLDDEGPDAEAEQAALKAAALRKKKKPADDEENLDVEMMVPFG
jgi:hypothetical protein